MDVHTHPHSSHKHKEICNHDHVLEGKNSSKGLNFNKSEEQSQKVPIVASFEEDNEKEQYASFKHIFINCCLRLICFIVTKLIIDSVHFEVINPPRGEGYSITITL